jgi:hypothetical protein
VTIAYEGIIEGIRCAAAVIGLQASSAVREPFIDVEATRPPYNTVLVDNGSTDGTAEYLTTFIGRCGFVPVATSSSS